MPFDAVCLSAVAHEVRGAVLGGKIDKIYQPSRDEIFLSIRGQRGNVRLLLSANPAHPRMQLTGVVRDNPASPPMFCMLLRKHLSGGRVLQITQPPMERVADLEIEALDEMGVRTTRHLILEAMGRRANLILTDGEQRIIDCLRRVEGDLTTQRPVLPGLYYRLPAPQDKMDLTEVTEEQLGALLDGAPRERELSQWLLDNFNGLSPLICRELAFRACGETDGRLCDLNGEEKQDFIRRILSLADMIKEKRFTPCLLSRAGKPVDFSYLSIAQYGPETEIEEVSSFGELLDRFYQARESAELTRQRGQDLLRLLTTARDRTARKVGNRLRELEATKDRERLRQYGDIITSNLYAMTKGMKQLTAVNYYDPEGAEVTIPLDPLRPPQQNAAKYYKDYNKAKTAEGHLIQLIDQGKRELEYLESVLEVVRRTENERDLQEIRQELEDTGYLRRKKEGKKQEKRITSKPMEFRSDSGFRISVGKNNVQNDRLTTKLAYKSDVWLHTQKIHGSHVILWTEGKTPDAASITQAAILAAYFSQARDGKNVPVDYTPVRYVKKPNGARPGMVIYETYSTAYVTPDKALVERLRVK